MTASSASYDIRTVAPASLHEPARNPNHMSDDMFRQLVADIRTLGFLQPVLVEEMDSRLVIVDGCHRVRAAKELKLPAIPIIVGDFSKNPDLTRVVQIGMNRLRGELNLSEVAATVADLVSRGWETESLQLTGFRPDELEDLLATTRKRDQDLMNTPLGNMDEPEPKPADTAGPGAVLELKFRSKSDLTKAKRALRKAAAGGELADGLLALIAAAD